MNQVIKHPMATVDQTGAQPDTPHVQIDWCPSAPNPLQIDDAQRNTKTDWNNDGLQGTSYIDLPLHQQVRLAPSS